MNTLIIQLMLLQVALPLVLIGMHGRVLVASMLGWGLRTLGIALVLLFVARSGVWLFPPWWTPWVLGALHVLASAIALNRYQHRASARANGYRIGEITLGVLLCTGLSALLLPTFEGRRVPAGVVALAAPLSAGHYLATSGGTSSTINSHLKTLDGDRYLAYRGQSYAIDLIGIDRWGLRSAGISPVDPTRYRIYGRTVTAPCTGTVAIAVDAIADMPVPIMDREHMLGNHVIIECNGVFVVLAHLAPKSLRIAAGDLIESGDPVGAVGNTGNTAEPHLHIHVQASLPDDAPISADPLWFTLDDRFLVRNDVLYVQ